MTHDLPRHERESRLKSPQKREFQACRGLQCSSRVSARRVTEYIQQNLDKDLTLAVMRRARR
jgi:hypothetical protein